jgi:hypothetical protein
MNPNNTIIQFGDKTVLPPPPEEPAIINNFQPRMVYHIKNEKGGTQVLNKAWRVNEAGYNLFFENTF